MPVWHRKEALRNLNMHRTSTINENIKKLIKFMIDQTFSSQTCMFQFHVSEEWERELWTELLYLIYCYYTYTYCTVLHDWSKYPRIWVDVFLIFDYWKNIFDAWVKFKVFYNKTCCYKMLSLERIRFFM